MDPFLSSISRNKSTISMMQSKTSFRESLISHHEMKFQDRLCHQNCHCFHCINNTKPIQQQNFSRIAADNEFKLEENQAYTYLIEKMSNFIGTVKVPDTFIANSSSLVYVSSSNKMRIKTRSNLALSEIKKYFDARRAQYSKIIKNQNTETQSKIQRNQSKLFNSTQSRPIKRVPSMNPSQIRKQKQMKQVAIINYKNNFNQLCTESCLSKYLMKRKNDSFWQEIQSISLIPPYKEDQIIYHQFFYERNKKILPQMNKLMQKMAQTIDEQDKLGDMCEVVGINPENNSMDNILQKGNKSKFVNSFNSNSFPNENISNQQFTEVQQQQAYQYVFEKISKQIVAFLEICHQIRISSSEFKFIIDFENNVYLTGVQKFIASELRPHELTMLHDRLKPFELTGFQELAEVGIQIQGKEKQTLNIQLAELVADCLEKRKLELKEVVYHRPSSQKLVEIFKKIFPNFNQEQVFTNPNWKNQFKIFISNCRKTINHIINQDEGIRILKRFGIVFYRTWN